MRAVTFQWLVIIIIHVEFPFSGAQTVHRAFGLKDGRYGVEQLQALFDDQMDPYYSKRKKTISSADVLLIDEISMLSMRVLNLVDQVCRICRGHSDMVMGGLQVILVGKQTVIVIQ